MGDPKPRGRPPVGPVDLHVANRLYLRRCELRWTQELLAHKVGVQNKTVSFWERGRNVLTAQRLYELAKTLEVEPGYFFEGYDD